MTEESIATIRHILKRLADISQAFNETVDKLNNEIERSIKEGGNG